MRLLTVFGTRPEAIKLAPVLTALAAEPEIHSIACVTGQHRELLDQALAVFGIRPDRDLRLMEPKQGLNAFTSRALVAIDGVIEDCGPDRVLVQGDTTTALAAALAAYHRGIPVAHVEAGLRTYLPDSPWPEEFNRRTIALVSDLHFAPTPAASDNLCAERLHGDVFVTGNTGIDALHLVLRRLAEDEAFRSSADAASPRIAAGKKLVLVTGHRRESLGAPFAEICAALAALSCRDDVEIVYPLHPNPLVRGPAEQTLAGLRRVRLLPPLDFPAFVRLMQRADLIVTDSGGVQEEAVALARPVLVTREVTERAEAIGEGAAWIVGTAGDRLLRQITALLDDAALAARFARRSGTYGDGRASGRIVDALLGRPVDEFVPRETEAIAARVTAAAE
jgi:UDP-N-acetylglucosamine 2-epimerase (non-hydrolysing)